MFKKCNYIFHRYQLEFFLKEEEQENNWLLLYIDYA